MSIAFFADRNCGSQTFPDALERAGIAVLRHDDYFDDDVDDAEWLWEVAKRGWVALSFDKAIRKNELERDAVFESGARLIQMTGAGAPAIQQARNFINTYTKILVFLERHPAPFIARLRRPSPNDLSAGKPGSIDMYMSKAQWIETYRS